MSKVRLTFEFDNFESAEHFAYWLDGSGEQDYWQWMKYREQEEDGDITVSFDYHKGCFNKEADKENLVIVTKSYRKTPFK